MKLITLNTWGGRAGKENLLLFFEKNKNSIDIFCLQEIWSAPYLHMDGKKAGGLVMDHKNIMVYGKKEIEGVLDEHSVFFRPHYGDNYGLMMMVNETMKINEEGEVFVFKNKDHVPEGDDIGNHARNIQYVKFDLNGRQVTVINFHGLWNGKGKTDSEDRILQSKNIISFIQKMDGEVVFCGDFNLLPDTESLKLFESAGLRNLILENNITSTRTSFYKKPEKYADYVFVSSGIKINDFKVLPDEVSDHAPLMLDFE